jgi:YD repeat-containing protein
VGSRSPIDHGYDWAGNEVSTVDVRGETWTKEYDASNRVIGAHSPSGLDTATTYRIKIGADPAGPPSTTSESPTRSGLRGDHPRPPGPEGHPTQRGAFGTSGDELDPTTYSYDVVGNAVRIDSPPDVWVEMTQPRSCFSFSTAFSSEARSRAARSSPRRS